MFEAVGSEEKPYFPRYSLWEMGQFIRFRVSLFIAGIALSGFLLFNTLDYRAIAVFAGAFLASSASYAYNQSTDSPEDLANYGKINAILRSRYGKPLIVCFAFLGFLVSLLLLPLMCAAIYVVFFTLSALYSRLRIKERFPLKNIYTGLVVGAVFIYGATAGGFFIREILPYYFMVSLLCFVLSLQSDLRDFTGDASEGIRTFPVVLGIENSKSLTLVAIFTFAGLASFHYAYMYPIVPFMVLAAIFLHKEDYAMSQLWALASFAFLPLVLILVGS
jgi:4-hydroxybenzoate polyprenyltransferase